jgi:hypothetical protein
MISIFGGKALLGVPMDESLLRGCSESGDKSKHERIAEAFESTKDVRKTIGYGDLIKTEKSFDLEDFINRYIEERSKWDKDKTVALDLLMAIFGTYANLKVVVFRKKNTKRRGGVDFLNREKLFLYALPER